MDEEFFQEVTQDKALETLESIMRDLNSHHIEGHSLMERSHGKLLHGGKNPSKDAYNPQMHGTKGTPTTQK